MTTHKRAESAWLKVKPRKFLLVLAGILAVTAAGLGLSPLAQYIDSRLARPLEFFVRERLQRSPSLDPRLKVYAFDSTTVAYLGYAELSLETWFHLIEHFAKQKPQAIFIDKIFSYPISSHLTMDQVKAEAELFVQRLKRLSVPVYVGGFVSPSPIIGRKTLSLQEDEYRYPPAMGELLDGPRQVSIDDWPPVEPGYFYGPYAWLKPAFRVGHIVHKGQGLIKPYYRLDSNALIPHLALLTMGQLKLKDRELYLNEQRIPLSAEGDLFVNFLSRSEYQKNTSSLRYPLERIVREQPEQKVRPGDWVVILPAMFSGNTDFKETPIGTLQGGYLSVSIMNSILSQKWLYSEKHWDTLLLLSGIILNTLAGLYLRPWIYFAFLALWTSAIPGLGLGIFVQEGLCLAWFSSTLFALLPGLLIGLERLRQESAYSTGLVMSLRGALPAEIAESIIREPALLEGEPREQMVTVMFIDIVGFSMTTERQTPLDAFTQLRLQLAEIIDKIHTYRGVVDKSLGDGVLAYFGYQHGGSGYERGHADRAVLCAREIQADALQRAKRAMEQKHPVYPLRIGLNTATVYLGNLGTDGRIDFTLIGNGVNLSARLEHACRPFRVMMGLSTFDLLTHFAPHDPRFSPRDIHIKHHKQPIKAVEFHPLEDQEEQLKKVFRYYRQFHRITSDEQRWNIPDTLNLELQVGEHRGQVLNFSQGGLAIRVPLELPIDKIIPSIQLIALAYSYRSQPLSLMPCWRKEASNGQLIYGCAFVRSNEQDIDQLVHELRELVRQLGDGQESLQERELQGKLAG